MMITSVTSPYYLQDVKDFFARNNFAYFNPHEKISIEESLTKSILDCYYGVFHDGIMIAYGMLRGLDEGYESPMLGIAVDSSYQGKGVGDFLMTYLETSARLDGYKRMKLRVHKDNHKALQLYVKYGYRGYDMTGDYLIMEKSL